MKKIIYFLMGVISFFTTACSNDDVEKLSVEVEKHLQQCYADAQIKSVHNWPNGWIPGTEVNLIDKDGNEVSIFYRDFKDLSLTLTKYASFDNLPPSVRHAFYLSPFGNMKKGRIDNIECDDYAQLPNKMYRLEFTYYVPGSGELYTQLTFNANGYMLPVNHSFTNKAWSNPDINQGDVAFINKHYGVEICSYDNLGGTNSYYVMDHDILKQVKFRDNKWKSTVYPLPLDTEVPATILERLYELEPNFHYITLNRVESPNGDGYQFLNDKGNGYILGDMFVKCSL